MTVLRPRSAREALDLYARDPAALPLAGGTDFMVPWNMGALNGRTVLDLSAIKEWRGVRRASEGLEVGALITHAELREHPVARLRFPLLTAAAASVGAAQIQNRGTIGGNIANASPAADTLPALAVYEAMIVVDSARGRRRVPLSEMFAGVKKTTLQPAELISAIEISFPKRPTRQLFRKVGTRAAMAISKSVAAGLLWLKSDGSVREMRFALGSMAPTVRRLKAAENFLAGRKLTEESARQACGLLAQDVSPIDDLRSTAQYRLQVSRNILAAFLRG
jgi:CO/xanthine dehydrogenase FAD-binding subunit